MVENCRVSDSGSKMNTSSSSSPTSYISGLSDDLLVEILCRLGSPKYATRCKCICKRWFSLVNSTNYRYSNFLRCWLRVNSKNNKDREEDEELQVAILAQFLLRRKEHHKINYSFINSDQELQNFKPLDFLPIRDSKRCILDTFRDIVLCCPRTKYHSVYYICNPFTRQWTTLPPPPPLPSSCRYPIIRAGLLVYEDEGCRFIFKVVRVTSTYSGSSHVMIVDIFSSDDRAGGWRQMIGPERRRINGCDHVRRVRHVFFKGMMVWLSEGMKCFIGIRINPFDPKVKGYFRIPFPLGYETKRQQSLIGVCMGRLRVAQLFNLQPNGDDPNYGLQMRVWELDSQSQSSWELVHELDFSEIEDSTDSSIAKRCYQNRSSARSDTCVITFHPHDGDMLYLFFIQPLTGSKSEVYSPVFLCNARKRTLKMIGGLPVRTPYIAFPLMQPTWPTQVPILSNPSCS